MFEEFQVCPYTGLRSFTEEESLYFKGREEHIEQASEQLQRNKFLMLTGASGDGKSSLVYAGIIPVARAGFLKSRYTQWCVADFRPERTPFQNLCRSLARQLDIPNAHTVEAELQHGFSALVDLYRNSKRFVDTESMEWSQADADQQARMKREAGNLIILVDQFEEFFTNPENYHQGVPSAESNLVLNLLLETARIALEEDLPIFVVFTMRSDYIGQCAAFRALPEYIGFSQFFVPRLNRSQLQQVIEEPAQLSGNRITRRLTERLIHDIEEGVDQLPILQHALNQIWHAANNGNEEMDLIHYAMVGGMSRQELPDEDAPRFDTWFGSLNDVIKACYKEPNLQNVLDTHTNKLYEQAAEYYQVKTGRSITSADAKSIIKTIFTCLTKIDQSRAVRNRMTLQEITDIIGRPEVSTEMVGMIVNIFREPGNTFIRPFITEDAESQTLLPATVLDITHESLIRNWQYLEEWAIEEYTNYTLSLDFEQQLNRWVESDQSRGFLLSIGQLTYFENWYNRVKPNAAWIARYLSEDFNKEKKKKKANQLLIDGKQFLRQSASKHVITRTVMRYGPRRIAAVLAIVAVLTLSSFALVDYMRKQNEAVLQSIKLETIQLANKEKLSPEFPVPLIVEQLMLNNMTIEETINGIESLNQQISIATGMAGHLIVQGRYEPADEIRTSLTLADSLLDVLSYPRGDPKAIESGLKRIRLFAATVSLGYFYSGHDYIKTLVEKHAKRAGEWAVNVLKEQPTDFDDFQSLTFALEFAINHKALSDQTIRQLLAILSPYEGAEWSDWIKSNFARDKQLIRSTVGYGLKHNGLFQELAYLYAALGDAGNALKCIDTLIHNNESYYQNDYGTIMDNATNVAGVFAIYRHDQALSDFVTGYSSKKGESKTDFYNRIVSRQLVDYTTVENLNFYSISGETVYNLNLKLSDSDLSSYLFARYREEIERIADVNERNLQLALAYKNEGILHNYRKEFKGLPHTDGDDEMYRQGMAYFLKVSEQHLNTRRSIIGQSGADVAMLPSKLLFLYPDYKVTFHPNEPRSWLYSYQTPSYVEFLLRDDRFDQLYKTEEDLSYFESWTRNYHAMMTTRDYFMRDPAPLATLEQLANKMEQRQVSSAVDLDMLYLHLGVDAFNNNQPELAVKALKRIETNKLLNAFQYKGFVFINTFGFELVATAIAHLYQQGEIELAQQLLNVFKKEVNRSSLYGYASQLLSLYSDRADLAQVLLDSAIVEMNRIENAANFQPNRHQVAIAQMYLNPTQNREVAYRTIKNSFNKFAAMTRFSKAFAFRGLLFEGMEQCPPLVSTADRSAFLHDALYGYNLQLETKPEWKKYRDNHLFVFRRFLPYVDEQN